MPQMGADMTEGTVVRWFKQVGDPVERGEIIAEIETDKANVELEAFESGTLLKLVAGEGDLVPVGDVIALLGEKDEDVAEYRRGAQAGRQSGNPAWHGRVPYGRGGSRRRSRDGCPRSTGPRA